MPLLLDISGLEALFHANYPSLCITAYRLVGDKDMAEDIVQDVFYRMWSGREELQIKSTLKAYLTTQVILQSICYLKGSAIPSDRFMPYYKEPSARKDDPCCHMALKEVGQNMDVAIKSLPETCRLVFVLRRYESLSYKQIATVLAVPEHTLSHQMTYALDQLRRSLLL